MPTNLDSIRLYRQSQKTQKTPFRPDNKLL